MAVNLSRNTKVYITTADLTAGSPVFTVDNTWEVQIQDGYSFSQATEATAVQLNEAGETPSRGQRSFNDSRSPAEWSFATYFRPLRVVDGLDISADAPELRLWSAMFSDALDSYSSTVGEAPFSPVASIDTTGSDKHQLASFGLIFLVDNVAYAIQDCAINTAEVSFDITGLAMVSWSGMGTIIKQLASNVITATPYPVSISDPEYAKTYIANKLSSINLASGFSGGVTYSVPITGGSVTISNNIEYLTPDTLGEVDVPVGYFAGTRAISGSLTAYLRSGASDDTSALIVDALANSLVSEPKYRMSINIGGNVAGRQKVIFDMPFTTIQIPTVEVQDIISTTINFNAQGATAGEFDAVANNELTVSYHPAEY